MLVWSLPPQRLLNIICCVFLFLAIVGYVAVGIIGKRRRGWDGGSWVCGRPHSLWGRPGAGGGVPSPQHSWIPPQLGPMETLEEVIYPLTAEANSGAEGHEK